MTKQMKCAKEFAKWTAEHSLNNDLSIYVDSKRYSVDDKGNLVYDIDADPKRYVEYAGDFMTVSTEGMLYDVINNYLSREYCEGRLEEMENIFKKYGKFYEMCYGWAFSLYDL